MIHPINCPNTSSPPERSRGGLAFGDLHKQAESLQGSELFSCLPLCGCIEILQYSKSRKFAPGETLFSQGQIRDKWIFIQRGTVKLTQLSPKGDEVIIWMCGPGTTVGVRAGSPAGNYTCSANAADPCLTRVWDRSGIKVVLDRYPQIEANISKILETRLDELEERFREVASENVADRLALLLKRLCGLSKGQTGNGIELRIRQQELAQMTGTTLFTVSRILARWASIGLVDTRRAGITVRDPDSLVANSSKKACSPLLCRKAS